MSSEPETAGTGQRRIPMADADQLTASQRTVYDKIVAGKRGEVVGPLRVALHSPELADRWQSLGEFLRFETSLPAPIRELAIIVTGRYWNCQVEWFMHSAIAAEAGIPGEIIESIRRARTPVFDDPLQAVVYEFTREILVFGQVQDNVYQDLLGFIDAAALVELTALVGYYSMVAMTLNVHRVPLPETDGGALLDLPEDSSLQRPTLLPVSARND